MSLGGPNSFGFYRLKGCILQWCYSWFKVETLDVQQSSTLRKTVLNRGEILGREQFNNFVRYPRKNRRRWRRSKRIRSFSSKAKRGIAFRKLKQSLVNVSTE